MKNMIFKIFNALYKFNFPLYRKLYYLYKNITDKNRIKFLESNLIPGCRILDVGSNIGFYTEVFSDIAGNDGVVYSFEPDAINYKYLTKYLSGKENINFHNKAVSDYTGIVKFYISDDLNVDHQCYNNGENRNSVDVECIKLDDMENVFGKIDFVKIDVQGYDYFVVKGMEKIIKNNNIKILGEFWPYGLNKAGIAPLKYVELIKSMGLQIEFFDKNRNLLDEKEINSLINNQDYYTDYWAYK